MAKKTELDTTSGQQDFEKIKSVLLNLKESELVQPNLDLEASAMAAITIAERANEPALRARFDALPAAEFSRDTIDALARAGRAALHVAIKARTESATTTAVKVDPALMQEAIEKRALMLRVLVYNLAHLPSVILEAEDIQQGTGYLDAASDLSRTSGLYTEHKDELKGDTKFYDPNDAQEAVRIASSIRESYRTSSNQSELWADFAPRVFTHLTQLYKDLQETAHWLLRKDPAARDQFPALRTAIGITPKKKKPKPEEGGGGTGGEGGKGPTA